jgi:glycerophosphoryl diester phosphodiesterase
MLDRLLIISFDWMALPEIKALAPALQTGALVSADTWDPRPDNALATLMDQVSALGCNWINMDRRLFVDIIAHTAHQHGIKLGLWTVNDLADMRRFASDGVDSLTSDRPDLFKNM